MSDPNKIEQLLDELDDWIDSSEMAIQYEASILRENLDAMEAYVDEVNDRSEALGNLIDALESNSDHDGWYPK